MALDDKAKETLKFVQDGYDEAEKEVDSFFARNPYTVAMLSGAALALVVLVGYFLLN